MNTSPSLPLAAYCSHGNRYKRFRTTSSALRDDVEFLLASFGASEEVRHRVRELLAAPDTAAGFRFESCPDDRDPGRTVVFACTPIPQIDAEFPQARDEDVS